MTRAEKLAQIAETEQKVYDKGYEEGFKKGKENTDTNVIENVEISLDFSNGDQTERLPEGYSANSVTIFQPETLVPKNIAKGVNIAGIIGTHEGGGSIEGVATVTFCNYDGTELYSRLVFIGDDCPEPVAQGKMDTPTRASDVQYNYTFNGWSDTLGGSASSTALKNITADKTVYAGYKTSLVYYTVRFYDGDTLMQESQVAYGVTVTPPNTDRDGYDFVGWTPSSLVVRADTDFYGEWIEKIDPYVVYEYDDSGNAIKASFMYFTDITSADVATQSTTITAVDFSGSPDLKTIGYKAFYRYVALTEVDIPEGVTYIGNSAFYGCRALAKISLPSTLTRIHYNAFYCDKLTEVHIADLAKYCEVQIEDGATLALFKQATSVYFNGEKLTKLIIPEGVTHLSQSLFRDLRVTDGVSIPKSLVSIDAYALNFHYSSKGGVYISDLSKWCEIAFASFAANPLYVLKQLYINGELATDIAIPDNVTSIGAYTFYACTSITSITIPNTVTSIGENAFVECSGLTSITIPDSVTSIDFRAFGGCINLASVNFAENSCLITIGRRAFYNCSALTAINIPESVMSIGETAFSGCSALTSATFADTSGWYVTKTEGATSGTELASADLATTATAATYLNTTYTNYYWYNT